MPTTTEVTLTPADRVVEHLNQSAKIAIIRPYSTNDTTIPIRGDKGMHNSLAGFFSEDSSNAVQKFLKSRNRINFERSIEGDIEDENLHAEIDGSSKITSEAIQLGKSIASGMIEKFWSKQGFQIGAWLYEDGGITVTARNSRLGRRIAFNVSKNGSLVSIITVTEDLTTREERPQSFDRRLLAKAQMLFH